MDKKVKMDPKNNKVAKVATMEDVARPTLFFSRSRARGSPMKQKINAHDIGTKSVLPNTIRLMIMVTKNPNMVSCLIFASMHVVRFIPGIEAKIIHSKLIYHGLIHGGKAIF